MIALDTNILVYAEGVNGQERRDQTLALLAGLEAEDVVLPAQTLGELFQVLTRKAHWSAGEARSAVMGWAEAYQIAETSGAVLMEAMELVVSHRLSFWDATILAVAAQSGCRYLWSEDMQDGFIWRGVGVKNPLKDA